MTVFRIPTEQDLADYTLQLPLDGVEFFLTFNWNTITAAWYMSISDTNSTPLLVGRKICINCGIRGAYRDLRLPPGEFIAYDTTGSNTEANINDLGTRVILLYYDLSEIAAITGV
jgi:hypothetical protein